MNPNKPVFISEDEKFRLRMQRNHTERFYILMRLIKISKKLSSAKIIKANP
jgi:hypothetical protein